MPIEKRINNEIDEAKYYSFFALDTLAILLADKDFWRDFREEALKRYFAHTNADTKRVVEALLVTASTTGLVLDFYNTRWYWQKNVIAHVKNSSAVINLNMKSHKFTYKGINRKDQIEFIADKIRTLGHEFVHVADNLYKDLYFGHGSNVPKNILTFPVFFGDFCRDKYLDSLAEKSIKKIKEIEKDMFNEINESSQTSGENTNSTNNESETINKTVQIPQEFVAFTYGGITYIIHEKRVLSLPQEYQDSAREVVKPTPKQLKMFGEMITWFVDRYAPIIFNNPFIVPLSLAGSIIMIEVTKIKLLSDIIEKAKNE